MDNKILATEAEIKAQENLVRAKEAVELLESNDHFNFLMQFITETKVQAFNDMLAFDVEGRATIFEELVWRSQLKKELASIKDYDAVAAREFLEG